MTNPVTNQAEWRTFRARCRTELSQLQKKALKPGLRADAWTPREVLHHVLLVDASTANLLERLLSKAKDLSSRAPDEPWPVRAELMDFPLDTAFSVPAFPGTEPQRSVSDKALAELESSNERRHEALADQASRLQLDRVSFPHPLAGRLNFYEWLAFGGIHERLHLTQLRQDVVA